MQNRIETLRAEIAQREAELRKLEGDQQEKENELDNIIKNASR